MKITAIKLMVGKDPEVVELEDELRTYQDIVEGHIDCVTLQHNLVMIVNDEGLIRRLPINDTASMFYWRKCGSICTPICGNAVLIGVGPDGEGQSVPTYAAILCDLFQQALKGGL